MRLTWGLFPYAIASLLVTVAVVDGAISWKAIHTFPGVVTHSQFTDSNRYDAVLEGAAREASLGWKSEFSLTGATPRVVLTASRWPSFESAMRAGMFALMRPVMTFTDGRCVESSK